MLHLLPSAVSILPHLASLQTTYHNHLSQYCIFNIVVLPVLPFFLYDNYVGVKKEGTLFYNIAYFKMKPSLLG